MKKKRFFLYSRKNSNTDSHWKNSLLFTSIVCQFMNHTNLFNLFPPCFFQISNSKIFLQFQLLEKIFKNFENQRKKFQNFYDERPKKKFVAQKMFFCVNNFFLISKILNLPPHYSYRFPKYWTKTNAIQILFFLACYKVVY